MQGTGRGRRTPAQGARENMRMPRKRNIVLAAAGGILAILVAAGAALVLLVDWDAFRPRLETAASRATGMEVRIGGKLGVGFSPGIHVTAEEVRFRTRDEELASARETSIGIRLLPLLQKKIRIVKIVMTHPRISIVRERDGTYNFEATKEESGRNVPVEREEMRPSLDVENLSMSDGTLTYTDRNSGDGFEAGNFDLEVSGLKLSKGTGPGILKDLSFTGTFRCKEFRTKNLSASDIRTRVVGRNGVLEFDPVGMRLFGGEGSGTLRADFSGPVPLYRIGFLLRKFQAEEFLKSLSPKKIAEGPMDFTATLAMRGSSWKELEESAEGDASLRGEGLKILGTDLDRRFARYEASQNLNIIDIGAIFFAGPFGPLITKGYNFAGIFRDSGGTSNVRKLVSDWKVVKGVAEAGDVAMATDENRVALNGRLDFVNRRFDDVVVALVDEKGCTKLRQRIHGPFGNPEVEKPNVLVSLAGPVVNILKKAGTLLGGRCEQFYSGSVAPPK